MKSLAPAASGLAPYGPVCPVCHGSTNRISRRTIDLLLSVFIPVRRYRCRSLTCSWEGNLRDR